MKISKNQLYQLCYCKKFNNHFRLKDDCELVLNSVHIYVLKNDAIDQEVLFSISQDSKGNRYIEPNFSDDNCDYLLMGYRLDRVTVVTIGPSDIVDKIEHKDGGYTFVIQDED